MNEQQRKEHIEKLKASQAEDFERLGAGKSKPEDPMQAFQEGEKDRALREGLEKAKEDAPKVEDGITEFTFGHSFNDPIPRTGVRIVQRDEDKQEEPPLETAEPPPEREEPDTQPQEEPPPPPEEPDLLNEISGDREIEEFETEEETPSFDIPQPEPQQEDSPEPSSNMEFDSIEALSPEEFEDIQTDQGESGGGEMLDEFEPEAPTTENDTGPSIENAEPPKQIEDAKQAVEASKEPELNRTQQKIEDRRKGLQQQEENKAENIKKVREEYERRVRAQHGRQQPTEDDFKNSRFRSMPIIGNGQNDRGAAAVDQDRHDIQGFAIDQADMGSISEISYEMLGETLLRMTNAMLVLQDQLDEINEILERSFGT